MYKDTSIANGSRFATTQEIKTFGSEVDWKNKRFNASGFPIMSSLEAGKTTVVDSDIHTLIFGGTGSKKTLAGVLPTLCSIAENGESAIITDSKGELYRYLKSYLKKKKIACNVINLRTRNGNHWNPLEASYSLFMEGDKDKAMELLRDTACCLYSSLSTGGKDPFWANSAIEYFIGLALILFVEAYPDQITLEQLANLDIQGNKNMGGTSYLVKYVDYIKTDYPEIERLLGGTIYACAETRGSILSTVRQPLSEITNQDDLNYLLSETDFSIRKLVDKQTFTFLIMPDEKITYNSIVSMYIKQTYELLIHHAEVNHNGVLPIRINLVLEEAGNIPTIDGFANMMTAARSRNIRLFLVFQSKSQIELRYPGLSEIIIGNCDCIVYLNSKDLVLLQYLSTLAGTYVSRYRKEVRPLISITQLQRLKKEYGECVVFLERQYPFITRLPMIFEYNKFILINPKPLRPLKKYNWKPEYFNFCQCLRDRIQKDVLSHDTLRKIKLAEKHKAQKVSNSSTREINPIQPIEVPDFFKKSTCETSESNHQITLEEILCQEE